jgi:hypothetical protein
LQTCCRLDVFGLSSPRKCNVIYVIYVKNETNEI